MFFFVHRRTTKQQTRALFVSLTLHGLFLAFLVHAPEAKVIAPTSALGGENGSSVTQIYWPSQALAAPAEAKASSAAERNRHRKAIEARLRWHRLENEKKTNPTHAPAEEPSSASNANSKDSPGATPPAGSQYGSLYGGPLGHEVRPALPVASAEPVVSPADLVGGIEGSVVIEITIDDKGNVVEKNVLQSLRPAIDAKVLAALENWHFLPATRDGVAIPSKQDVYYHFKPN
jgi:TonB family protein